MIEALGYIQMDEEFHAFSGDVIDDLKKGLAKIEATSMHLKKSLMSEDDRKKQELLEANQAAYAAKQKADKEFKKGLVEQ